MKKERSFVITTFQAASFGETLRIPTREFKEEGKAHAFRFTPMMILSCDLQNLDKCKVVNDAGLQQHDIIRTGERTSHGYI